MSIFLLPFTVRFPMLTLQFNQNLLCYGKYIAFLLFLSKRNLKFIKFSNLNAFLNSNFIWSFNQCQLLFLSLIWNCNHFVSKGKKFIAFIQSSIKKKTCNKSIFIKDLKETVCCEVYYEVNNSNKCY